MAPGQNFVEIRNVKLLKSLLKRLKPFKHLTDIKCQLGVNVKKKIFVYLCTNVNFLELMDKKVEQFKNM